ncbi:unnamed protein product [Miscanthus lutarioriparius]|uniref:Uncharacterized protein n=1 Tax=Miscanthus lutarioriparius TaxID=422564 RepID=A0A811RBH3_9POAL|nr:unnamed protein product [Miscanthus lutarioriparius]
MAALQVRLGALSAAAAADAFSVGEHGLLLADLSPARPHGRSAWRCCRASLRRTLASDALLACVGVAGGARTPSIGEGAGRWYVIADIIYDSAQTMLKFVLGFV